MHQTALFISAALLLVVGFVSVSAGYGDESIPPPRNCLTRGRCNNFCRNGYESDSFGCQTCRCKDHPRPPVSPCKLPKVTGSCRAAFRKWHFNQKTNRCELFIYRGCRGNGNRFNSQDECERTCPAIVRPCFNRAICNRFCPNGFTTDFDGCPTCQCKPTVPVEKPGSCPKVSRGIFGICLQQCSGDFDCRGSQKCCSNGCGNVCSNPVGSPPPPHRVHPGTCPAMRFPDVRHTASLTIFPPRTSCFSDSNCRFSEKCCRTRFGRRQCIRAVRPQPPVIVRPRPPVTVRPLPPVTLRPPVNPY